MLNMVNENMLKLNEQIRNPSRETETAEEKAMNN